MDVSSQTLSRRHRPPFWLIAVGMYCLCWGWWVFFPSALFWDDWAFFYDKSPAQHAELWALEGKHYLNRVLNPYLLRVGFWPFRLLVFGSFGVAAIAASRILNRWSFISRTDSRIATLLFLVLPINGARYSLQTTEYAYSYAAFFLGWWLMPHPRRRIRIVSALLFLISFGTPSMMVYFAAPLLELCWRAGRTGSQRSTQLRLLRQLGGWMAMPLGAWLLFQATENAGGKYKLHGWVLIASIPVLAALTLAAYRALAKSGHGGAKLVAVGVLLLGLATVPYLVVYPRLLGDPLMWIAGLLPSSSDWGSRHALLWPLGLSLSVVGFLRLHVMRRILPSGARYVVMLSVIVTMWTSVLYLVDSWKQRDLIATLQNLNLPPDRAEGESIAIVDLTTRFNARNRAYRGYEWEGIILSSLGSGLALAETGTQLGDVLHSCDGDRTILVLSSQQTVAQVLRARKVQFDVDVIRAESMTCP